MEQLNRGDETQVNGIKFGELANNNSISVGTLYYTYAGNQWMLRYMKDTNIEDGLRLSDELTLRFMHDFK